MLDFWQQHKGSALATLVTVILGSVVMVTALNVGGSKSVAPTAQKSTVVASGSSCTLSFPVQKKEISKEQNHLFLGSSASSVKCIGLSATPLSGNSPLPVTFFGYAQDLKSTIIASVFSFGDGQQEEKKESNDVGNILRRAISHTYQRSGTFDANVYFVNVKGEHSTIINDCKVTIQVF